VKVDGDRGLVEVTKSDRNTKPEAGSKI
jgi:hypothetical protein